MMKTVIKVLICPEFYMTKEPISIEKYEHFRLRFVLTRWTKYLAKA
jgi:hypothetical protein